MRGQLTKQVQKIARKHIGRKISQTELRLIPYIQYLMTNEQKLDPAKINEEERKIFMQWKEDGYCEGGMTGLSITKKFWNFMCEVLYQSYVLQEGDKI